MTVLFATLGSDVVQGRAKRTKGKIETKGWLRKRVQLMIRKRCYEPFLDFGF